MHNRPTYNPQIHHRRSIRLHGYDYASEGLYFVTICCQDRELMFGRIIDNVMMHNDAGLMINKWVKELENKFQGIAVTDYITMPNHFHGIIKISNPVGAHLRVRPNDDTQNENTYIGEDAHAGAPLHTIVQWFKTMTTNEYIHGVKTRGWKPFRGKLWQRNYYEHIIRDEQGYLSIADYILNNPATWQQDSLFTP